MRVSRLTAHSSRAGAAITLLMLGASREQTMDHCRWALAEVFCHYTKLERIRQLDLSAHVLQSGVTETLTLIPPLICMSS